MIVCTKGTAYLNFIQQSAGDSDDSLSPVSVLCVGAAAGASVFWTGVSHFCSAIEMKYEVC